MKKNLFWIFSIALLGLTIITTTYSCETDPCADVVCENADCFDGECICRVGFVKDPVTGDCIPACDDADCVANASCVNNECVCDIGYERDANNDCVLERAKFLGTWTSSESCDNGQDGYNLTLSEGTAAEEVLIRNFYNVFDNVDVIATVIGTSITIDRQDPTGEMVFVSGSGTYNSDGSIDLSYTIDDTDPSDPLTVNCTATWIK